MYASLQHGRDSNPRRPPCPSQRDTKVALPLSYRVEDLVDRTGIEPVTFALPERRATIYTYSPFSASWRRKTSCFSCLPMGDNSLSRRAMILDAASLYAASSHVGCSGTTNRCLFPFNMYPPPTLRTRRGVMLVDPVGLEPTLSVL